jgi:uncharacterized protein (TIGR03435 family)
MNWESQGIALLAASIVRPFALAAAAWLVLRAFRVRHPASQHAVWTAVLIGMVLLPFLSLIAPRWKMPVLPPKHDSLTQPQSAVFPAAPSQIISPEPVVAVTPPVSVTRPTVETLIVWFYLTGFLAMLAYRLAGWILLRRVVSRSRRLRGHWLRESGDVVSPVAIGVLRPAVLLPVGWRDWSINTRTAVLAHEFAHLRRNDTLVASLARFLKCMLWFHPLAWWLSRRISELAELACDAAALEIVRDPARYSRVLLQFARGVNGAGSRVALPGLAMAGSSELSSRIDQVFELSVGAMRRLSRPRVVLAVVGVPAMCLAATVGFGESGAALSRIQLGSLIQLPSAPFIAQVQAAQPRATNPPPAPAVDRNARWPRFESASLEIAGPPVSGELCWGGCGGPLSPYPESRNQITYRHFTLKKILLRAYDVKEYQIFGPGSIDTDAYDVSATAAPGTTQEQFQLMLRNLLAERLQLTLHQEAEDLISGYELTAANGELKLKESQEPAASIPVRPLPAGPGFYVFDRQGHGIAYFAIPEGSSVPAIQLPATVASVPDLARLLRVILDSPVVDRTGLTKQYDIDLAPFVPSSILRSRPLHVDRHAEEPAFYVPLQRGLEQLGLKLEEKRSATDLLFVDHVGTLPPPK